METAVATSDERNAMCREPDPRGQSLRHHDGSTKCPMKAQLMISLQKKTAVGRRPNVAVRCCVTPLRAFALAAVLMLAVAPARAQNLPVRIIGINDFHGHLEPGENAIQVEDPTNPGTTVPLRSGGAAFLAARISQLKSEQPNHVVVSAGDLVGASPLASGLFQDEPTIEVMNSIGLDVSALGNHEFDYGVRHILR